MSPNARDNALLDAAMSVRKALHLIHLARAATTGQPINEPNLVRLRRAAEHLGHAENGVLQLIKESSQ